MNNTTKKIAIKYILMSVFTAFLIILDQYTKHLADIKLKNKDPFIIIKDVFEFKYLDGGNTGMAWGLFSGKIPMFILITVILVILIIMLIIRIDRIILKTEVLDTKLIRKYTLLQIVLAVLLSGAIGNMIDRLSLGYVIDFIYFKLINFPLFNVADCYVTVTEFLLFFMFIFIFSEDEINLLLGKKKHTKEDNNEINE